MATQPPAILPDRDSPLYPWARRPADHNPLGLYTHGPQPAASPMVRLMGDTPEPVAVPSPAQCRHRQRMTQILRERRRQEFERFRASLLKSA